MKTKWVVTTILYGRGGIPVRNFDNYNDAYDYYLTQKDDTWNSVIMEKVETIHRFTCSKESNYRKIK